MTYLPIINHYINDSNNSNNTHTLKLLNTAIRGDNVIVLTEYINKIQLDEENYLKFLKSGFQKYSYKSLEFLVNYLDEKSKLKLIFKDIFQKLYQVLN